MRIFSEDEGIGRMPARRERLHSTSLLDSCTDSALADLFLGDQRIGGRLEGGERRKREAAAYSSILCQICTGHL